MKIMYLNKFCHYCLLVICAFILLNVRALCQNDSEFVISDSTHIGNLAIDNGSNLYVVLSRKFEVSYRKYNSLFNPLSDFINVANNPYYYTDEKVVIRDNYMVVVWEDLNGLSAFNSEIGAYVSNLNGQTNPINFYVNEPLSDAFRYSPGICFINDTTFFAIWNGNGRSSPGYFQVYGRIISVFGRPLTSEISINDKKNTIAKIIYPKISHSNKSNKLLITWISNYESGYQLQGRMFYADGEPVDSSFAISGTSYINDVFYHDMSVDSAGNFVVVWAIAKDSVHWELQWKWFNPNGETLKEIKTISTPEDSVSSFSQVNVIGNYLGKSFVVWNCTKNNRSVKYAKFILANGSKIGNNFRISENDTTSETASEFLLKNKKIYCAWDAASNNWFGTFGRILDLDNPYEGIVDKSIQNSPNNFSLYQNYPNPFNPTTIIRYQIPSNGFVTLKVYDILGREIETLINKAQRAGRYSINFNASGLASRIYFYRLIENGFMQVKKMIVLK